MAYLEIKNVSYMNEEKNHPIENVLVSKELNVETNF